ncbi:4-alpha-glucanotransferase [Candidatus Sumerlaeota bacterium]
MMQLPRSCGILLHPTCLPGKYGIGEIGGEARRFVDFLAAAGQGMWQLCPLGPTGFGDSPYQCFSAFAGNPLLIELDELAELGLLGDELTRVPAFPPDRVVYGPLIEWKNKVLSRAFETFHKAQKTKSSDSLPALADEFECWRQENGAWLDEFALFMALKDEHGGAPWPAWSEELRGRDAAALEAARQRLSHSIERHAFCQFLFFRQWHALKKYANASGVSIIGDVPIFVAHDSADAWANQELFHLDARGRPTVVAGVPPDFFSATGQRWGNPLFRWRVMARDGYAWWIERLRTVLGLVDLVRVDHFRGFEAYWQVPAKEPDAVKGRWVKGPGQKFFRATQKALGTLPIIAEDLGVITPEVEKLRDQFNFPGMKILQFAFGDGADHEYLPHNFSRNCVVYTGTHDNDTTLGWYGSATEKERAHVRRLLWVDGSNIVWDLIHAAYSSVADLAIIPLQDVLGLGAEARMNFPGRPHGNWTWRCLPEQLTDELARVLLEQAQVTNRVPLADDEDEDDQPPAGG